MESGNFDASDLDINNIYGFNNNHFDWIFKHQNKNNLISLIASNKDIKINFINHL